MIWRSISKVFHPCWQEFEISEQQVKNTLKLIDEQHHTLYRKISEEDNEVGDSVLRVE